jgi:anti-anti-sigma factor
MRTGPEVGMLGGMSSVEDPPVLLRVPCAVIDHWTVDEFVVWVRQHATGSGAAVLLDFTDVEFLMAAGVRALVELDDELRDAGRRLTVTNESRIVRRVLEVCELADRFAQYSSPA